MSEDEQRAAGCVIGEDYPAPVVDHKHERERAMARYGAVAAAPLRSAPAVAQLYLQRDQPPGVPPLQLTGERTLPDVPEENYWYRRHLVVYEWIASRVGGPARGRPRLRRGLRLGGARPHGGLRRRGRRQPRGVRARAAQVHGPEAALRAQHARAVGGRRRLRRVPADDRARAGPRRRARAAAGAGRPGRRRLRLDAQRADPGPEGRGALGQPLARARVPRRGVPGAVRAPLRLGRAARPVPRAQAARPPGGDRAARVGPHPRRGCGSRSRSTTASRRRSPSATSPCARATSTARWTSSPCCDRERALAGALLPRPAHAHALRRGLRDVAVRRGVAVGGDGDLATCRCSTSSTRRPGRATLSLTPVLCDQLEAPGVGERFLAFLRDVRPETHRRRRRGGGGSGARARARALRRPLRRGRRGASRRAAATSWAPSRRTRRGRRRRPTPCCRCWPRPRACACSSRRGSRRTARRFGRWARRALAAGVRARAVARPRCSRRPACTPPASTSPTCSGTARRRSCARCAPARARCSSRSTGRSSTSSGAPRLSRRTAPTATRAATPSTATRRGRSTARPMTPRARRGRRAPMPRDFVAQVARRIEGGGLCVCALDTELLGHFWHEGVDWLAAVVEACDAAGVPFAGLDDALAEGRDRPRRRPVCRRRAGARRATCAPGARPRRGARVARAGRRAAGRSAGPSRAAGAARAARAAGAAGLRLGLRGDRAGRPVPTRARGPTGTPPSSSERSRIRWHEPFAAATLHHHSTCLTLNVEVEVSWPDRAAERGLMCLSFRLE